MTPAINLLRQHQVNHSVHHYQHEPSHESYGEEAASKLEVEPERVFKTLVVALANKELAVAVLPVTHSLSMKAMAKCTKSKKVVMANPDQVERSTGYVLGGVSPLGQKKQLLTVIDHSALSFNSLFISAGKRGLEIELSPHDLASLLEAQVAAITEKP